MVSKYSKQHLVLHMHLSWIRYLEEGGGGSDIFIIMQHYASIWKSRGFLASLSMLSCGFA